MSEPSTVVTWDYKEQPDWDEINFALVEQIDAFCYQVETGSDQYAVLIGPRGLSATEAQARYDEWYANRT